MNERYGIVYMGSKEKILHMIDYIFHREHNKKYMIDLFAGGMSVSAFALFTTKFNVISNDINEYVIDLYREILNGGENFKLKKYDWISREHFIEVRDNPSKFQKWYVGYVLNVWSFGCNQKDYLYAFDLEENKHAMHEALVNDDFSLMEKNPIFKGFESKFKNEKMDYRLFKDKRLAFMENFNKFVHNNKDDERFKEWQRLEHLVSLSLMEHIDSIADLKIFRERLTLLSNDWKLTIENLPEEVLKDCFVYCDPPYEDTKKYQFGTDFNYEEFWEWFRNAPFPVYVSSYKAPRDIEPIHFDLKAQLLDNGHRGDNKKKKFVSENIYWNGVGNPELTMADLLFNS